jgi:drug/metabolite transporter (DMT)-like permease
LLPARAGGGALRWWHVAGAGLGFAGTLLILLQGGRELQVSGAGVGLGLAFAAAVIWSSYSVASRMFAAVPSIAVIGSCAVTAVASALLHVMLEQTIWPASATAWLAVVGLGLGPVGLAFYLWDEGMKRGDIRLLGVASYATPLVSTLVLAATGLGTATTTLWLAAALITAGALIASLDRFSKSAPTD